MSFKLTIGKTSITDIDCVHNEAIISVVPYYDKDNMIRNYLFYIIGFMSNKNDTTAAMKGATLNSKTISKMLIPLPPLDEQKRIVDKLDQIFEILK